MSVGAALLVALAIVTADPPGSLPRTAPLPGDSCVDHISLKGGPRLLGAVLGPQEDGTLLVAVSREWLRTAQPKFFEQSATEEHARTGRALTELQLRLERWLEERKDDRELTQFLTAERQRIADKQTQLARDPSAVDPQFLLLAIAPRTIDRVQSPAAERRKVAFLAWREQLPDVEKRTSSALRTELRKLDIDPAQEADNLSAHLADRFPPMPQTDVEWAARVALVEYQFRKPLDFQGQGDFIAQTGNGAPPPDMIKFVLETFRTQLDRDLADIQGRSPLLGKPPEESRKWLETAKRTAEQAGVRGFRVTRVRPDLARKRATVESLFVAKVPSGDWVTAWRDTEALDVAKVDQDAVDALEHAPQIARAFEILKGTDPASGERIRLALNFGAATQLAQKDADAAFFKFRDRYVQRLEEPVLLSPSADREAKAPVSPKSGGTPTKKGLGKKKIAK